MLEIKIIRTYLKSLISINQILMMMRLIPQMLGQDLAKKTDYAACGTGSNQGKKKVTQSYGININIKKDKFSNFPYKLVTQGFSLGP